MPANEEEKAAPENEPGNKNETDEKEESAKREKRPSFFQTHIIRLLKTNKSWQVPCLILLIIVFIAMIAGLGYFCWYKWLKELWGWGFTSFKWVNTWGSIFNPNLISIVKAILAFFGLFYLVVIPIGLPTVLLMGTISSTIELIVSDREEKMREQLNQIENEQSALEKHLEKADDEGLIPIISLSRKHLKAYYETGLSQARQSFNYSVTAMWFGFLVIISGIAISIILPIYFKEIADVAGKNISYISISGGIIIEFISALFLWIYRSSVIQLRYFYNRQMYNYNILLCNQISKSLGEEQGKDKTKSIIIEKILEKTWTDAHPVPGLQDIKDFIKK